MSAISNIIEAGENLLRDQSGWKRRKDTVTSSIVLIAWVAGGATAVDWGNLVEVISFVALSLVGIGGVLVHALTEGSITPSQVRKMTDEAERLAERDEPTRA